MNNNKPNSSSPASTSSQRPSSPTPSQRPSSPTPSSSSSGSSSNAPKTIVQKLMNVGKSNSVSDLQLSQPSGFKHVGHIGIDETGKIQALIFALAISTPAPHNFCLSRVTE